MIDVRSIIRTGAALTLAAIGFAAIAGAASATTVEDYKRADKIRSFDPMSVGGQVRPAFLKDGMRFTYLSYGLAEKPGEYFLVDPQAASRRDLFNAPALAKSLSEVSGSKIDPWHLPGWTFDAGETRLGFMLPTGSYECDVPAARCRVAPAKLDASLRNAAVPDWAVRSPDGHWDAFVWNHNVYIRPANQLPERGTAVSLPKPVTDGSTRFGAAMQDSLVPFIPTGQLVDCDYGAPAGNPDAGAADFEPPPAGSIALTHDGEALWSYGPRWKLGAEPRTLDSDRYRPTHGSFAWSPDSKKLLTRREDIRGVGIYPLYSSTSVQPIDHSYFYSAPGARSIPQYDYAVLDIATRKSTRLDVAPTGAVLLPGGAEWSADAAKIYVLSSDRGPKEVRLSLADAKSGEARPIIREASSTFVEMSNGGDNTILDIARGGKDVIWFSERDGWGHLYRFDGNGKLKNQIENGAYSVAELVKVDDRSQQIYFTAWGKAPGIPYYRHLFRIGFDGSGVIPLTPEDGDHYIQAIPGADFFLDTMSSIESPPRTVLRRADGTVVMTVSVGSDTALRQTGWHPAETFSVKARDGVTDLYGVMFKPSTFDPTRRYPIITNIYPGPFVGSVGPEWRFEGPDNFLIQKEGPSHVTHGEGMGQSLAELGFIVIKLDALGSARRSKAMQDTFYGHALDNGLADQVAAIGQLARRYSWIDPDRVGIFGHSGGGYAAAAGMLTHPDIFKVGVSESGNHDFRTYGWYWGEQYMGLLDGPAAASAYAAQADYTYAANLKGKLLLMHGDMDCNNPPAQTLRLVDALVKAHKSFDLLMLPDYGHQLPEFAMLRAWNYFVQNLGGEVPPPFDLTPRRHEF